MTLLHEMCHAYAEATGIRDTSRDGRYHNRRFAEIALAIGLQIERDARIGHRTPRLTARSRVDYDDLLVQLKDGLVLMREAQPAQADHDRNDSAANNTDEGEASKYVFASCGCRTDGGKAVMIRVARGSWRQNTIRCSACATTFSPSF